MHSHCVCPECEAMRPTVGTPLAGHSVGHSVGNWQALPETNPTDTRENTQRGLQQCECGCNVYSPALPNSEFPSGLPDVPVLPLVVEYEDDDAPSDDHEYVSIKITELADMTSALRSCTCQDH